MYTIISNATVETLCDQQGTVRFLNGSGAPCGVSHSFSLDTGEAWADGGFTGTNVIPGRARRHKLDEPKTGQTIVVEFDIETLQIVRWTARGLFRGTLDEWSDVEAYVVGRQPMIVA